MHIQINARHIQLLLSLGWRCSFSLITTSSRLLCFYVAPEVTSQGHDLPHSSTTRGSIPALHCLIKVQSTSHIPSQPHIHRPPIYTRLLMATLINFTGRQSNKALLWRGGAADVWCNLRNIFKWALTSQATTLVLGGWYQGGREREGEGGEEK